MRIATPNNKLVEVIGTPPPRADAANQLADAEALAREIVAKGHAIGLPFTASATDIGSPRPPVGSDGRPLAETVFRRYQPNRVVVGAVAGAPGAAGLPLLADRGAVNGRPTAYVCRRYVCQLPVTEPDALARQLDAGV